jgi:HlyD family secretion protein
MKKINFRIPIIIILTIVLIVLCHFYFKDSSNNMFNNSSDFQNEKSNGSSKQTTVITTTTEVASALTENIELHATYYLDEIYVEENQLVKKGEKILKYTNGKYLTAPYDCVIIKIKTPDTSGQCTNDHYIQISSNNILQVQFKIDETKVSKISLGDSATIKISALDDKEYDGVITSISNTASNGKFTVVVEFDNDEEVKLGMTATVTI